MKLLALILFSTLAVAQSPRTHQDAYALPDAPSASQPTNSIAVPLGHPGEIEIAPPDDHARPAIAPTPAKDTLPGSKRSSWRELKAQHPDVMTVDDIKEQGFFRGHPTRTKWIIAGIGGGVGLTIALATRHNCPKYINGYRYDGTPPCPGKDYDPGGKSVGVRWRF